MSIAVIVAMARDRAIGAGGDLLWHLSADLKRFKALTSGHTIIMGRKTYDSLPNGALPNRRNIVISRTMSPRDGVEVVRSLAEALRLCRDEEQVFVIGGGEIYREALSLADSLHLTLVEASYPEADTHFPDFDWAEWQILREEYVSVDERNPIASTYYHLQRIRI